MLKDYCNQSVTLKSKSTVNDCNEATYTISIIKARFEYKRRLVRNNQGEQILSEARVFTESVVRPGDVLTFDSVDRIAIAVQNMLDLDGCAIGYEVSL